MKTLDSRTLGGGFFPFQTHNRRFPVDERPSVMGYRIVDRKDGINELGHYVYDDDTVGDLLGTQFWPPVDRPMGLWGTALPAIVSSGASSGTPTGSGSRGCSTAQAGYRILPIRDKLANPDERFEPRTLGGKSEGNLFLPTGTVGISVAGTEETQQEDLFLPTDRRLVAAHAGDARMSTPVFDLTNENRYDPTRLARLHNFWRVLKKPAGSGNALAWQITPSSCDAVQAGYVVDLPGIGAGPQPAPVDGGEPTPTGLRGGVSGNPLGQSGNSTLRGGTGTVLDGGSNAVHRTGNAASQVPEGGDPKSFKRVAGADPEEDFVVGMASQHRGGPFDVGAQGDRHFIGKDADGHDINSLHLSTNALFRRDNGFDGPFLFEGLYEDPGEKPQRARVHLEFDGHFWRWRSESAIYVIPPKEPKKPKKPPPRPPRTPTGGTGGTPTGSRVPGGELPPIPGEGATGSIPGTITIDDKIPGTSGDGGMGGSVGGEVVPPTDSLGGTTGGGVPTASEVFGGAQNVPTGVDPNAPFDVTGNSAGQLRPSGGGLPKMAPRNKGDVDKAAAASQMEFAAPTFLSRPQGYREGSKDYRNNVKRLSPPDQGGIDGSTPMTGGMTGWGQEGGVENAGTHNELITGGDEDPWVYTERPGRARYPGGTAAGGFVLLPPEVGMEDLENGLEPPGFTISDTHMVVGPNAYFAAGIPSIVTGKIRDGWRWGMDTSTGDLVFSSMSAAGDPSEGFRLDLDNQNIRWRSGTSFDGILDHDNTANRTYTFPDSSGTVVLSSSTFTEGSVIWANASGQLDQNNANFFWDNTPQTLCLGHTTADTGTVLHTADAAVRFDNGNVRMTNNWVIDWRNAADDAWRNVLYRDGSDIVYLIGESLEFQTNQEPLGTGSQRMTIAAGGGVGINQFLNIGGVSDATVAGDLAVGLSSQARMSYDQSNARLRIHIDNGSIPAANASTGLVVSNTSATGDDVRVALVTGATGFASLDFGDTADMDVAYMRYDHSDDTFAWRVAAGAENLEWDGSNLNITGTVTSSALTAGRVLLAGTAGIVEDSASLTFDGSELTAASATISDLTSGRVVLAGTAGALQDNSDLIYNSGLGVGESSPTARIHVREDGPGASPAAIYLDSNDATEDAIMQFTVDGGGTPTHWCIGVDNGSSDACKVSQNLTPGTNDHLTIDTTGTTTIAQELRVGTATDAAAQGDFSAGLTGAGRIYWDQSSSTFFVYNAAGSSHIIRGAGETVFNELGSNIDFRIEGDTLSHMLFLDATATTENIALLAAAAPNWQAMDRGLFIGDTSTAPTGNPASGGFMYSNSGAGTWRGSGGTVTAFGPAGPHCGNCGYDFWRVASENKQWGASLRECGMCGKVYKRGPKSVLNRLTKEQKAELIYN